MLNLSDTATGLWAKEVPRISKQAPCWFCQSFPIPRCAVTNRHHKVPFFAPHVHAAAANASSPSLKRQNSFKTKISQPRCKAAVAPSAAMGDHPLPRLQLSVPARPENVPERHPRRQNRPPPPPGRTAPAGHRCRSPAPLRSARQQVLPQPVRETAAGTVGRAQALHPPHVAALRRKPKAGVTARPRAGGSGEVSCSTFATETRSPGEWGARGTSSKAAAVPRGQHPPQPRAGFPPAGKERRARSPPSPLTSQPAARGQPQPPAASVRPPGQPAGRSGAGEAARPPAARGRLLGGAGRRPSPLSALAGSGCGWPRPGQRGVAAARRCSVPRVDGAERAPRSGLGPAPAPPPRPPPGSPPFRAPPGGAASLLKGAAPGGTGGQAGRGAAHRVGAPRLSRAGGDVRCMFHPSRATCREPLAKVTATGARVKPLSGGWSNAAAPARPRPVGPQLVAARGRCSAEAWEKCWAVPQEVSVRAPGRPCPTRPRVGVGYSAGERRGRWVPRCGVPAHLDLGGQVRGRWASSSPPWQPQGERSRPAAGWGARTHTGVAVPGSSAWPFHLIEPCQPLPPMFWSVVGVFWGSFRHAWAKQYLIMYLKGTKPNESTLLQQRS